MSNGKKEYSFKRTLKYDSKWLDSEYTINYLSKLQFEVFTLIDNNYMYNFTSLRYLYPTGAEFVLDKMGWGCI